MPFIRKRGAHLFSKTRFIAAQFHAYFDDDLWLGLARHANAMANRLASGIRNSAKGELAWANESNEVFVILSREKAKQLQEAGAHFYDWPMPNDAVAELAPDQGLFRLVTSYCTEPEEVDRFLQTLG
jgi:threonine aldolase